MQDAKQIATNLKTLCDNIVGYEWGALGAENAMRNVLGAIKNSATVNFGVQNAFFAFANYPLNLTFIALMADILQQQNINSPLQHIVLALQTKASQPENTHLPSLSNGSATELQKELKPLLQSKFGCFWLEKAFHWCLANDHDGQIFANLLNYFLPLPITNNLNLSLRARLLAGFALARQNTAEALNILNTTSMPGFELWQNLRRADCLVQMGSKYFAEAIENLWPVWQAAPMNVNIILALHQLKFNPPNENLPPQAILPPILLYSWNKKEILAATLQSLLKTEAASAPVFVLDNGSQDGTTQMLKSMAENFSGGLNIITLPVNIGAPPARNWLLALPEVQKASHAVFLDDDLILPKGWLADLLWAAEKNPSAGNFGCCITDYQSPCTIQGADFFALPTQMGQRSFVDLEENILIHCSGMGMADTLLTKYARPCLSVSGCCHLISMAAVKQAGEFDIRFNPSQFDDLERDLRLNLNKIPVIYTGNFPIKHVQHSSLKQANNRSKNAHIFGNKIKLEFLYPKPKVDELREFTQNLAKNDLLRKTTQLATTGSKNA